MRHRLWHFHGGLELPGHKGSSTTRPALPARLPRRVLLPLQQHVGSPAEPLVTAGERVLKGQRVARATDFISAHVHASTSGTVVDVGDHPVPHSSGLSAPCIVIEPDGEEEWTALEPVADARALDPARVRNRIREAGIVGLGGAAFPTHVKLNPGPGRRIHTLILNGAECEPYITCDDMLLRERAREVLEGAQILCHAVDARRCLIALEDDTPEAAARVDEALAALDDPALERVTVPAVYPMGGEKQLIRVLTGQEVPSDGLPLDIGVLSQNVATAYAVYRAIAHGEPLISRYVTVTGDGVAEPRNLEALIGTPMADLIDQAGGYRPDVDRLIMGGSMMGFALATDEVPAVKGTNCVLAMTPRTAPRPGQALPCIRCGECAAVCPARLLPQQLYWYARARDFDEAQEHHLFDCIECGCCAHVCPSHIPLVQYYRFAKSEIWARERERRKAEVARLRYEARQERLERERRERAERSRRKQEALRETQAEPAGEKKKAIEAAVARVRARRGAASDAAAPASEDGAPEPGREDHGRGGR
ncbi:MAG: electron transport complex subunit RsxC [Gammaproteobacteria bacterium]|nr:electron transport complex subunit RsxC [Gammaproteobacteria bacterium]